MKTIKCACFCIATAALGDVELQWMRELRLKTSRAPSLLPASSCFSFLNMTSENSGGISSHICFSVHSFVRLWMEKSFGPGKLAKVYASLSLNISE
jgi:hypothetical protein